MPAMALTPSSTLRVTSLSTTSGEAPGYSVCTTTTGKSMFGNWSTFRRCSENRPSTTSASITIVAKTGFFRLTRVNHMVSGRLVARRRGRRACGRAGELHRRAFAQRTDVALDHLRPGGQAVERHPRFVVGFATRARRDRLVRDPAGLDHLHIRRRLVGAD